MTTHQTCSHCGADLGPKRPGKGRPRSRCEDCRRKQNAAFQRTHRGKAYKAQYQKDSRNEARALVLAAKQRPCVDCGIQYHPAVMDLDHVRGEKSFNFGMLHKQSGAGPAFVQKVRDEIAKCDVRCSNCHRLRHALEREAGTIES